MDAKMKERIKGKGGRFVKMKDEEECVVFPPRAVIMEKGELPDIFYWMKMGEVAIEEDGIFITKLGPGNFIGEIAFQRYFILGIKEARRTATVRAITEVVSVPISGDVFEGMHKLISSKPGLFLRLFTQAVRREDALIEEVNSLKEIVKKLIDQNNQFQGQIINLRDRIKRMRGE